MTADVDGMKLKQCKDLFSVNCHCKICNSWSAAAVFWVKKTQMSKTLYNPIAPLFGEGLQSWLTKLRHFQLIWEDFLDYETSSFSPTCYFLSLVSLLSCQIILHSQDEVLASFYKLSSYCNILFIIYLLIKSSHCTSAVFTHSLESWEYSLVYKLVQSTGIRVRHLTDQLF